MHFKSLDYPHSHVSVIFYTRFLTHGYTKHRCELLWITRSRLIILKCRKLVLRLSRQSWGAKHQSCPEILNCTCIYAISYTIGNVGNRLGCDQENRDPTFSFPNKLNKCFFRLVNPILCFLYQCLRLDFKTLWKKSICKILWYENSTGGRNWCYKQLQRIWWQGEKTTKAYTKMANLYAYGTAVSISHSGY